MDEINFRRKSSNVITCIFRFSYWELGRQRIGGWGGERIRLCMVYFEGHYSCPPGRFSNLLKSKILNLAGVFFFNLKYDRNELGNIL